MAYNEYDEKGNLIHHEAGKTFVITPNDSLGRYVKPSSGASSAVDQGPSGSGAMGTVRPTVQTSSGSTNRTPAANSVSSTSAGGATTIDPYSAQKIMMRDDGSLAVFYGDNPLQPKVQLLYEGDPKYTRFADAYTQTVKGTEDYDQTNALTGRTGALWYQNPLNRSAEAQEYQRDRAARQAALANGLDFDGINGVLDAIDAEKKAAEQAYMNALNRSNQGYDDAARQAYIQMMQSNRLLPQQLAALGLAGTGTSETAALQPMLQYQNDVNANEQQRINNANDIYAKIAELDANAMAQKANAIYDNQQQMNKYYWDDYTAQRDRQWAQEDAAKEQAYNTALSYLQMGTSSNWIAEQLGLDRASADYLAAYYKTINDRDQAMADLDLKNAQLEYATNNAQYQNYLKGMNSSSNKSSSRSYSNNKNNNNGGGGGNYDQTTTALAIALRSASAAGLNDTQLGTMLNNKIDEWIQNGSIAEKDADYIADQTIKKLNSNY